MLFRNIIYQIGRIVMQYYLFVQTEICIILKNLLKRYRLRERTKEQIQVAFKQLLKYLRGIFNKCFEVKVICKSIK